MNLICPFAIQRPGPDWKRWPQVNTFHGVIEHSAEGYEDAMWNVLDGPAEASWHFSIMQTGDIFQHYPLDQSPWHAGSKPNNLRLVGIEHEGVAGEPLTPLQRGSSVRLTRWIAQQGGWAMNRATGPAQTLYEHRELFATACPSGRIPWAAYTDADEATIRTLPLDFNETAALFRGIAANVPAIFTDNGATAELVVSGYTAHPERDTYIIQIPRGTGRGG